MDLDSLFVGAYVAVLCALGLFGVHRIWMVARFRWNPRPTPPAGREDDLPVLTVQLPLFNERTVAARLIRAVGALEYPRSKLEIQVLDDSTDETRTIVEAEVRELVARGLDARILRRPDRSGFKAGALAHGLTRARGELIAMFDADFVPHPDFLLRLVPVFADPGVGMAQARWDHMNRDESLLTRAQATLLDGHFVVEHTVRHSRGLFFNFNGTAGVWRRRAIEEAGGWQHDTLTEDLDLSYRAQLAGWRFVYLPGVTAPAEVPSELGAFQSQQYRWAKGSVQVARKLGSRIASSEQPLRVKTEAGAHLTANAGYPFVVVLALLLPRVSTRTSWLGPSWHLGAFLVCTLSVIAFYERSQRALGRAPLRRLIDVPAAMALGIGMSLAQTRAVLSGLFRRTGEFVRTPKRGAAPASTRYRAAVGGWAGLELLLAAWYGWALVRVVSRGTWGSLPFLALFFLGFAWVGTLSLLARRARAQDASTIRREDAGEEAGVLAGKASSG